jgi:hypothetical protein
LAYFDDEGTPWGEDVVRDDLYDEYPELRDDAQFQDYFAEMFGERMNWDEAHDAYDDLRDYLDDEYDINIDDYFNWEDWRVEHMDS